MSQEALSPLSESQDGGQRRQCWVCFGSEQDEFPDSEGVIWRCPCQCRGTMKWVHEECLQRWIDEKQKRTNSPRVTCSQCKTHYILRFPAANCVIRLLEKYDKLLYGSSPFVAVSIVIGSIYWCCGSYGFISIIQIMGHEEGKRLIDESDQLIQRVGLPAIPMALILAKLIKWEDFVLRLWRDSAFKLPRPLSYVIDPPPAQPRANCDQILLDPGLNEPMSCVRMVCGALLLPTISALVGKIFFSRVSGSQWRRSLLGGLAFLFIKGAMKIYFRKSQYLRYSQRSIENYVPSSSRSSTNNNQSGSHNSNTDGDTSGDDADAPGSPGGNNLDLDNALLDDSDEDNQIRERHTVFSMTIRI